MEPQISDYYNEEPYMMRMIENMNVELSESQKENEELKKKVKLLEDNNCGRPLVEKTVISQNEITKYALIEQEMKDQFYNIMADSVQDEELDFRYLFDHENDYINILKSNLLNVSYEWCEFRIKNTLEKYVSLLYVDEYWWGNLINTDGLSDIIINNIINKEAKDIMNIKPITIKEDSLVSEALSILNNNEITALFVTNKTAEPKAEEVIGIIHLHDCLRVGAI